MQITSAKDGWVSSLWSQMRGKGARRMRVAETLALGGKRTLVLVECDGQPYLVGCGDHAVNSIVPVRSAAAERGRGSCDFEQEGA